MSHLRSPSPSRRGATQASQASFVAGSALIPVLEPLLRVDEVAAVLKLSSRQVRRMIADKVLRSIRIGRAVRVSPDDLKKWIKQA